MNPANFFIGLWVLPIRAFLATNPVAMPITVFTIFVLKSGMNNCIYPISGYVIQVLNKSIM